MKIAVLALFASLVVIAGGIATALTLSDEEPTMEVDHHAGADEARMHHGMAGDVDHDGDGHPDTGMDRPAFAPAEGSIPSANDAQNLPQLSRVHIHEDTEFNPENGVRSGNGTLDDPYIISGYYFTGDLYIADTDACVVVRENYIGGQLTLNWNGQCVHAHHNYIRDLRVNENIRRDGYATGGLLELNKIQFLGQLRHYDGEFRDNVVGPFTSADIFDTILETVPLPWVTNVRVANIDGFNQGLIHHNTFYGSVDLDLHGHHHGTGFFAPHSHYHGEGDKGMDHDHTDRWTSVSFTDNIIIDEEGYGLRYDDQNHAGDDRTANSEDEDDLDLDHMHHTWIEMSRNEVTGGGIWVDIFNADDRNHDRRNPGWLDIMDNTVVLEERDSNEVLPFMRFSYMPNSGIDIQVAKEVDLQVTGNTVSFVPLESSDPLDQFMDGFWNYDDVAAGIRLYRMADSNATIEDNKIIGFDYGVWARDLASDVSWSVSGNIYDDVQTDVYYDESVANEPNGA